MGGFFAADRFVLARLLAAAGAALALAGPAAAETQLPSGFRETVAFQGLTAPIDLDFSPDGRVFVAEKSGKIKVFSGPGDRTPSVFADLSANVHDYWDRGMMALALHPSFPETPYVYVAYAKDETYWGDSCHAGDEINEDCVVHGRLSRLEAQGDAAVEPEQVLIQDWCQQFPSHSLGDLAFGPEGALYVSGGEGASYNWPDWGQAGSPPNPCSDPPLEGGAFRSQDVRTPSDPTGLDGTVIRIDPATGDAWPSNPLFLDPDPNARRIIAQGLRNPFRFEFRPGTGELWIGDVGWSGGDEVDRLAAPGAEIANFGWPCYEGSARQTSFDELDNPLCESLYDQPAAANGPVFSYAWDEPIVGPNDGCAPGGSAITGLAFYSGDDYPGYDGALFVSDFARSCIWLMRPDANGDPDGSNREMFATQAGTPVDLEIGPGGDLYYVDIWGDSVRRIRFVGANGQPTASAGAAPTSGPAPLRVSFDGTGSSDPDSADPLTYAWDFEDDGTIDSTAQSPSHEYTTVGVYTAGLTVTDTLGASDEDTVTVYAGTSPPDAEIEEPSGAVRWSVGSRIAFRGRGHDAEDGEMPASALSWRLLLHHCHTPDACHLHMIETKAGAEGELVAPDHEYPSYIELELTATDSTGIADVELLRLAPNPVELSFRTEPAGLDLVFGPERRATPFSKTVIIGSKNSVSAPTPQGDWSFSGWADAQERVRQIVAPADGTTYTARFAGAPVPPAPPPLPPPLLPPPPPPPSGVRTAPACVVPRLVNATLTTGRRRLARAHCRLGAVRRRSARAKAGRVLTQGARPGTRLPADAKVALTVSRGPKKR
ncbi:MAG TPA: PQQ-dependent sugar dehydrogenase [Gaiellaceae bacterium]|nr:PQQ-dependent sugar dehydrogenase [Gaiellaceae bacterium]